ncbi:hypothetical protein [Corynebacterium lowii]|uniref:Peptidase M10 metallopeptidase domain-containing protein n=1 Tax=Corynebacterium lowii TaxID=1544413 RepID=A0A0Q1E3I3_9CORY|nr:hypothetical protein [Corynebacterium lowii]KQB87238.1 hypothetical protein Clow_00292 [Corynebacterium lowii]MDP9852175.1 hypothetical protein [Corynebacterium lowii]
MRYLRAAAATLMACVASVSVVQPASARDYSYFVTDAQCRQVHRALESGQPIPYMEKMTGLVGTVENGQAEVYLGTSRYADEIRQSVNDWNEALGGQITIEIVDAKTERSINFSDVDGFKYYNGITYNHEKGSDIELVTTHLDGFSSENRSFVISHEMGHSFGMNHGCGGSLMADKTVFSRVSTLKPSELDVALVLANNLNR